MCYITLCYRLNKRHVTSSNQQRHNSERLNTYTERAGCTAGMYEMELITVDKESGTYVVKDGLSAGRRPGCVLTGEVLMRDKMSIETRKERRVCRLTRPCTFIILATHTHYYY